MEVNVTNPSGNGDLRTETKVVEETNRYGCVKCIFGKENRNRTSNKVAEENTNELKIIEVSAKRKCL